jgi:hypothetical protein
MFTGGFGPQGAAKDTNYILEFKSRSSGLWPRWPITSPWRQGQHGSLKHWYPTIALDRITTQKTLACVYTAIKTSNLYFENF